MSVTHKYEGQTWHDNHFKEAGNGSPNGLMTGTLRCTLTSLLQTLSPSRSPQVALS